MINAVKLCNQLKVYSYEVCMKLCNCPQMVFICKKSYDHLTLKIVQCVSSYDHLKIEIMATIWEDIRIRSTNVTAKF
jgi:hypothetical protein